MIFQVHSCLGDNIESNVYFRPGKGPTNDTKNKLNSKQKIAKMSIKERATKMVLKFPRDKADDQLEHRKGSRIQAVNEGFSEWIFEQGEGMIAHKAPHCRLDIQIILLFTRKSREIESSL